MRSSEPLLRFEFQDSSYDFTYEDFTKFSKGVDPDKPMAEQLEKMANQAADQMFEFCEAAKTYDWCAQLSAMLYHFFVMYFKKFYDKIVARAIKIGQALVGLIYKFIDWLFGR